MGWGGARDNVAVGMNLKADLSLFFCEKNRLTDVITAISAANACTLSRYSLFV